MILSKNDSTIQLDTIESAIADIKMGKIVIVVDDQDRENEGDFIAAAEKVTPEMVNFMTKNGRGLICTPLTEHRCEELELNMMVNDNTVLHKTAFTISIDLIGKGCTTGISTYDRAKTIYALTQDQIKPSDLGRPGHIFPLKAKEGGVLRRTGHTEASIDLARLAGLKPAGILVEILNEDGNMARLPELKKIAMKFNLKLISIEDLVAYRMQHDSLIKKIDDFNIETHFGNFRLRTYNQTTNDQIHLALTKGSWTEDEKILCKINNAFGNDILDILTVRRENKLDKIFKIINDEGKGAVIFINQKTLYFQLEKKIEILKKNQGENLEKLNDNPPFDERDFGIGAQILHHLNIRKLKLLTQATENKKRAGITGYGLQIMEIIPY